MTKCFKIPLLIFQNNINNHIIYLSASIYMKSNYCEYFYVGKLSKVKRLNHVFITYGSDMGWGMPPPTPPQTRTGF